MDESEPTDIALYLVGEVLSELPEDEHLYKLDLHKLLFLLRHRLDEGNQIADRLPFYWYRHGPVSQAAFSAGEAAARQGVAEVTESEEGELYSPGPETPPEPSIDDTGREDLAKAADELSELVAEYPLHQQRDILLEEQIYVEAPYRFQPEYKFNALPTAQEFARGKGSDAQTLMGDLTRAEGKLPVDTAFSEFRRLYSRFVTLANTFLVGDTAAQPLLRGRVADLTETAWRVFCNQLRCETADPYYEPEIDRWERQAKQSLRSFEQSLGDFEEQLRAGGFFDETATPTREDDPWGKMAASLLNGN